MADHSYNANKRFYISITDTGPRADNPPRVSTLYTTPAGLNVLGNLPHGYTFKPTNAKERDRLCSYLQSIEYPEAELDNAVRAANKLSRAALIEAARETEKLNGEG